MSYYYRTQGNGGTSFEERGVELQRDSLSVAEANRRFQSSCIRCCSKGRCVDCDYCAINAAHAERLEILAALSE